MTFILSYLIVFLSSFLAYTNLPFCDHVSTKDNAYNVKKLLSFVQTPISKGLIPIKIFNAFFPNIYLFFFQYSSLYLKTIAFNKTHVPGSL